MKLFRTALTVVAAMLMALFAMSPANAQYPPSTGTGQVSATTVEAGDPVTFSGSGFAPGAALTIADNGTTVQTVNADATGAFSVTLTLTEVGTHVLSATGQDPTGGTRVVSATVTVVPQVDGAPLPTTGSSTTLPSLLVGLLAVMVGSALVFAGRRRRRSARLAAV